MRRENVDGLGHFQMSMQQSQRDREILLQDKADVGTSRAGWIVADHASLIRAKHPLASRTDGLRSPGNGETDRRSGAVACPHEDVPGLGALSKVVIDQA